MAKIRRRAIQGVYKGYWCDSTWELAYVVYNLDNRIKFARNSQGFPYTWYRKVRHYYPDFILQDGTYVEIKGVMDGKDRRKMDWFPHPVRVLGPAEMKPYLDYAIVKYGTDFHKLFEKSQVVSYRK